MIVVLNINNIEFFSLFYLCLYVGTYVGITEIIGTFNLEKTNFQLAKKLKHAINALRKYRGAIKINLLYSFS
jgi:hypothetical protein